MKESQNITSGEILLEEFMKPLGLSQYALAKELAVSPMRISEIVRGKRAITADTALRLGIYFGTFARHAAKLEIRSPAKSNPA
jgi:addiction module HigA family antidote